MSNNVFTGKLFNGFYYWDIDPTTGKPEIYNILYSGIDLSYFPNNPITNARLYTPINSDSTRRILPNGLFSVDLANYERNIEYQREVFKTLPRSEPNYVLDTEWVKLNNLLDFKVGDSVTSIDTSIVTEFFIKYSFGGKDKVFKFAIAPSSESYTGGPNQTPEVKAGILTRSSMAIKTFTLAGGQPAYQVLGVEPTLFYLTGLFIGAETTTNTTTSTNSLTTKVYDTKGNMTAVKSAEMFDSEVAKSGRPIEVHLYSKTNGTDEEIKIKYMCLVQNARYFMRRSDRVYYALDLFLMRRLS